MIKNGIYLLALFALFITTLRAQSGKRIVIDTDIDLYYVRDSVFIHTTWHQSKRFGRFPSNGLVVIKKGQALLIDTPMDNDKTRRLTKYIAESMLVPVTKLIIGHFHADCMGGLEYLHGKGVESIANLRTIELCEKLELPVPQTSFKDSLLVDFNGEQLKCTFFGAGHTADNIVVWISGAKVLFGGCLIKSINSNTLGNLSDADVSEWDETVEKVMRRYPGNITVVPGHGFWGGPELLMHTLNLIAEAKRN